MNPICSSDLIKLHRSKFWGIVILFPFIILAVTSFLLLINIHDVREDVLQGKSYSIWGAMWMVTYYSNFVMIHLFVSILTSFFANVEHQANAWKHLFSLPISRMTFYWTRYLWLICGLLLSGLFLMLGLWLIGVLFGGGETLNWSRLFYFSMFPYLGSFALMGFQLWLSMNIKNQTIPIITGGLGIVIGLFMLPLPGISQYLPWIIPYQITLSNENIITHFADIVNSPNIPWKWVGISLFTSIIFVGLGSLQFARKEVI